MGDPIIPDMVSVSRLFWVAAANALRRQAGVRTSEEPQMTDAEAWQFILRVARGDEILESPASVSRAG
jgi:hypothetical protein